MFAVIYSFEIYPGKRELFIEAWEELTHLIKEYEGGLGSRLHQQTETLFIAYAQWPEESTWKNSNDLMPKEADQWRAQMKGACKNIETIKTMEMVSDLLEDLD